MALFRGFLLLACLGLGASTGVRMSANPIRRVVTMLQMMQKKVTEEGKAEQELFDKAMCFCKKGGAALAKSIEGANTKIPQLESELKSGGAQKSQLSSDIVQAKSDKKAATTAMAEATAIRDKTARSFAKEASEQKADIAAMGKAIISINKGQTGFLQTPSAAVLRRLTISTDLSISARDTLTAFLSESTSSSSEDEDYEPQGGEIEGILEQMKETMQKDAASSATDEAGSIKDFDALMAAKTKEVNALQKEQESKIARVGETGVAIVNNQDDLENTEKSLAEDTKVLANLGNSCKIKASEWDARQKTRGEELVALSDTIKLLNDDDALELFKKTLPSASFLQLQVTSKDQMRRARHVLRSSTRVRDFRLDLISMSMQGRKVNFGKVLGMLDDMVRLLKKEQVDDDKKKEYCASSFDKAEDEQKDLSRSKSDLKKKMADEKEVIGTLAEEIEGLSAGIATLDKAVADATQIRQQENAAYKETMGANNAAVEIIGIAKNRMNKFYNPSLHKKAPKRKLSEEDQIVVNMGGTAPPTEAPGGIAGTGVTAFDQEEAPALVQVSAHSHKANGVIRMMDILISDVKKESAEAKFDEKDAQGEYETFMADSTTKRAADSKAVAEKEAAKADMASKLQSHGEEKKATTGELMANGEYSMNLHKECDWLVQNFDVRKTARVGEIDSLTKSKAVLSGMDE